MEKITTKDILNVTLVIAILVIGKKVGEKLGLFSTKEDAQEQALEEGSTGNAEVVDKTKPELCLNPNYWISIGRYIDVILQKQGKPKLTSKQHTAALSIEPNVYPNYFNYQIDKIVLDIKNSKGWFDDNEDALYAQFQKCKSQYMISYVSHMFQKYYNKDMWSYLQEFLSTDEQSKIYNIIKNKPLFKI